MGGPETGQREGMECCDARATRWNLNGQYAVSGQLDRSMSALTTGKCAPIPSKLTTGPCASRPPGLPPARPAVPAGTAVIGKLVMGVGAGQPRLLSGQVYNGNCALPLRPLHCFPVYGRQLAPLIGTHEHILSRRGR